MARPEWSRYTLEWLKKWGFPEGNLVFSQNKGATARSLGVSLALNDAPHEIRSYAAGVPALAYAQPYNMGLGARFRWNKRVWK